VLSHLVRTFIAATVMAALGYFLLFGGLGPPLWGPLVTMVIVSNILWLVGAALLVRSEPSIATALVFGLLSPIAGALLVSPGWGLEVVFHTAYICFPLGLLTGYLVFRSARRYYDPSSASASAGGT
jgi:hypothetical protein